MTYDGGSDTRVSKYVSDDNCITHEIEISYNSQKREERQTDGRIAAEKRRKRI